VNWLAVFLKENSFEVAPAAVFMDANAPNTCTRRFQNSHQLHSQIHIKDAHMPFQKRNLGRNSWTRKI